MVNHLLPSSAAEAVCFTHCAADACVSHDGSVLWEVYSLTSHPKHCCVWLVSHMMVL